MKLKMRLLALLLAVVLVVGMVPAADAVAFTQKGKLGITSQPEQETTEVPETETPENPETTESVEGSFEMSVTAETLGADTSVSTTNAPIVINLFDYGSYVNQASQYPNGVPIGLSGASNNNTDTDVGTEATTVGTSLTVNPNTDKNGDGIYDGINKGTLGMYPVLVGGYPAREKTGGGIIDLKYLFDKTLPATTDAPYADQNLNDDGYTNYAVHRYPVIIGNLFQQDGDYLSFNSMNNHVWYEYSNGELHVENYAVNPTYVGDYRYSGIGHFLPFNGPITNYSYENKEYQIAIKDGVKQSGVFVEPGNPNSAKYSVDSRNFHTTTAQDLYYLPLKGVTDPAKRINMWVGMSTEFSFNQPEDGKKNGTDMIFEFSGDDLMWVYIDDVMILDIASSGAHGYPASGNLEGGSAGGAKTATINFSTGEVIVYKVDSSELDIASVPKDANGYYQDTDKFNYHVAYHTSLKKLFDAALAGGYIDESEVPAFEGQTFADFTTHTFKMFYMDTGHGTSNCKLKFNLDPIPTNDVTLEKQVTGINNALTDDQSYTFTLSAFNANLQAIRNISYVTTLGKTGSISNGETISLVAGEKVTFKDIPAGADVSFVEDTENKGAIFTNTTWTCEGNAYTAGTAMDLPNSDNPLDFVCTNQRVTKTLTVTKTVAGDSYAAAADDEFEIVVKIAGNLYTGTATTNTETLDFNDETGSVKIKAGEFFEIVGIPSGMSYEVYEIEPQDHSEYVYDAPTYTNASGSMTNDVAVTVTNHLRMLYGNLVIKKTGIQTVDHDNAVYNDETLVNGEERQNTIFHISGTSDSGVPINMDVTICGNGSVTIVNLPVGTYTVTEKTDWSWRYEPDDNGKEAAIIGGQTTETAFANTRDQIYWLSGDNWVKNLFNQPDTSTSD